MNSKFQVLIINVNLGFTTKIKKGFQKYGTLFNVKLMLISTNAVRSAFP